MQEFVFSEQMRKNGGINTEQIGAVGGSAGGHLVGLLATTADLKELHGEGGHHEQTSEIQAVITLAGPWQMTTGAVAEKSRETGSTSNSNIWFRKTIDEAPELYALADAHLHISKKTPPTLFMVGEHDQPLRNSRSVEKLKSLGISAEIKVYQDGKHGCWNRLPWFTEMSADMGQFFKEHLK